MPPHLSFPVINGTIKVIVIVIVIVIVVVPGVC